MTQPIIQRQRAGAANHETKSYPVTVKRAVIGVVGQPSRSRHGRSQETQ